MLELSICQKQCSHYKATDSELVCMLASRYIDESTAIHESCPYVLEHSLFTKKEILKTYGKRMLSKFTETIAFAGASLITCLLGLFWPFVIVGTIHAISTQNIDSYKICFQWYLYLSLGVASVLYLVFSIFYALRGIGIFKGITCAK